MTQRCGSKVAGAGLGAALAEAVGAGLLCLGVHGAQLVDEVGAAVLGCLRLAGVDPAHLIAVHHLQVPCDAHVNLHSTGVAGALAE